MSARTKTDAELLVGIIANLKRTADNLTEAMFATAPQRAKRRGRK